MDNGDRDDYAAKREAMVERQLEARGIQDSRVLQAMREVPREAFVDPGQRHAAYQDGPLPIGEGQTISQPFIVALMTQALEPTPEDKVLEVGTGSGYAAAVLGHIVAQVYTIERIEGLARAAEARLKGLGYDNVHVLCSDGSLGWPEEAPFDGIVVTAGGPEPPPQPLLDQLAVRGRLVIPVGRSRRLQQLIRIRRQGERGYQREALDTVQFVPLLGEAGWGEDDDGGSFPF